MTAERLRHAFHATLTPCPVASSSSIPLTASSPAPSANPANRTFFLQARKAGQVVSVGLEKVQVAVLAERLDQLLDELDGPRHRRDPPTPIPADTGPLDEPLIEAFRATTLTLGWDGDAERILIEARADPIEVEIELDEDDDEEAVVTDVDAAAVEAGGSEAWQSSTPASPHRSGPRSRPARTMTRTMTTTWTGPTSSGSGSRPRRRDPSWSARRGSSRRGGRRARCAASRSIPRDTSAREETATTSISRVATTAAVVGHLV